jgi:hypothetical protein
MCVYIYVFSVRRSLARALCLSTHTCRCICMSCARSVCLSTYTVSVYLVRHAALALHHTTPHTRTRKPTRTHLVRHAALALHHTTPHTRTRKRTRTHLVSHAAIDEKSQRRHSAYTVDGARKPVLVDVDVYEFDARCDRLFRGLRAAHALSK